MLLVLVAPSVHDVYYKNNIKKIIHFQIEYAKSVIAKDNIIVILDKDTKHYFEGELPEDILLVSDVDDIWIRDFATVNPLHPVEFKYSWASVTKKESEEIQSTFTTFTNFTNFYGIKKANSDLILDGGNLLDNYHGDIITTTRFLKDNKLSLFEGTKSLEKILNVQRVAIIEPDEEVLAHADGIVMWIDKNTLAINNYTGQDDRYQKRIIKNLKRTFPDIKIVEIPIGSNNTISKWGGFSSVCGIYVNAVVTFRYIYVPVFSKFSDRRVLSKIRENTSKKVIPIIAKNVCSMGGSVRCLTWQLAGENALKLIEAARKDDF